MEINPKPAEGEDRPLVHIPTSAEATRRLSFWVLLFACGAGFWKVGTWWLDRHDLQLIEHTNHAAMYATIFAKEPGKENAWETTQRKLGEVINTTNTSWTEQQKNEKQIEVLKATLEDLSRNSPKAKPNP